MIFIYRILKDRQSGINFDETYAREYKAVNVYYYNFIANAE